VPSVLLVTCSDFPDGEPAAEILDRALRDRGVDARWVAWDDPGVDWSAADLVAVRATWDYDARLDEFLAWAERVPRLLNGAGVFRWNTDKAYLVELTAAGLPVVPTRTVDTRGELAAAVARHDPAVVKPRVGAGGRGVEVVSTGDPVTSTGPWVVQPLVESVRTVGEISVFVLDGQAVCQVDKRPAAGEIRVHEWYGGASVPAPLDDATAVLAVDAMRVAAGLLDTELPYGRADLMWLDDAWVVGELELVEPGLYLDVVPGNAEPFAELLARRR
jgi:hypothetical protein